MARFAPIVMLFLAVTGVALRAQGGPPAAGKSARYAFVTNDTVISVSSVNSKGQFHSVGFAPGDANFFLMASKLDPLGRFFFGMTNFTCNAVDVYTVAPDTGLLTVVSGSPFVATSLAGSNFNQQALAITPDGKFMYPMGIEDGAICNGNSFNNGISGFSIDPTTGALTKIPGSPFANGRYPLGGVVDGQGKFLYTADNNPVEKISSFSIDSTTGALTEISGSPFDICGPPCLPVYVALSPNNAFLFAILSNMDVAVFSVNQTTGALGQITGSPFPSHGASPTGLAIDPSGRWLYVSDGSVSSVVWVYSINPTTGVPTLVSTSPFLDVPSVLTGATDPKGNFFFAPSYSSYYDAAFKINHSTGEIKLSTNIRGPHGTWATAFSTGTAAVKYIPKFAYVANSGSNSVSEYSISSDGTLSELAGSPLADASGPTSLSATPAGTFVFAPDANHKVSGYSVGASGGLTAVPGSPFSGFTKPAVVTTDPSNTYAFVIDAGTSPNPGTIWMEAIGSNGALTLANPNPPSVTSNNSNTPVAAAMGPGSDYLFVLNSAEKALVSYQAAYRRPISISGARATVATGNGPSALAVDPTNNYIFVTNSGDGTVSAYKISDGNDGHNHGTPVPIKTYPAGTTPSAVLAEPSGKYVYVANSGSSDVYAYKMNAKTGKLTRIAGTFGTGAAPDSLAVSNDGKFLYASNKSSGSVSVFAINSTGTLTAEASSSTGTDPASIATTGTRK